MMAMFIEILLISLALSAYAGESNVPQVPFLIRIQCIWHQTDGSLINTSASLARHIGDFVGRSVVLNQGSMDPGSLVGP